MRTVVVWREVYNTLWQSLEQKPYEAVCALLFDQLEQDYEELRNARHPEDETLFVFRMFVSEREHWHTFEFHVDDTMADTHLFVVGVAQKRTRIDWA